MPAARPPVTGIVTCFNEERHIAACLESLAWCDEIVVLDSFSTDRTAEIARAFPRVRFLERTYYGAAAAKNFAMDQARHEWMFILDADERCTPELQREIEALLAAGPERGAWFVKRRCFFLGREIRFSGWRNDRVVRLIRRGAARHEDARVHPKVVVAGGAASVLTNPLVHYVVEDFHAYLQRMVKYGYWGAAQAWREGKRAHSFADVLFRPAWRFLRTYVLQLGFLDGGVGIAFCLCQAFATYAKWSVLWSWQLDAKRGREPQLPEFEARGDA
ncbi:MAG: glycosyltransferase family 2 protein [Deltaproteobacteria bacterium]|nr:glycosyltransferase family 2 protein [Deltaproteobacteria bacterium]